jgi:hypothetical protein
MTFFKKMVFCQQNTKILQTNSIQSFYPILDTEEYHLKNLATTKTIYLLMNLGKKLGTLPFQNCKLLVHLISTQQSTKSYRQIQSSLFIQFLILSNPVGRVRQRRKSDCRVERTSIAKTQAFHRR